MNQDIQKRPGIKWPICTILIITALGALGYWGFYKFQSERALSAGPKTSIVAPPSNLGALSSIQKSKTYRGGLPAYFLIGFSAVMTTILGGILYLWWSLKDWEGGKKYGEDDDSTIGGKAPRT